MKRVIVASLLACVLSADHAFAGEVSIGVFAGTTTPSETTDGDNGSTWNLVAPIRLLPKLMVEPFFARTKLADQTFTLTPGSFTLTGATFTTGGARVALMLGGRVSVYPYLGLGFTNFARVGDKRSAVSYLGGLGLGVSLVPKLRLDARAEQHTVPLDTGSRGLFSLSLGVSTPIATLP